MPQKLKQTQDISLGDNLRKLRNQTKLTQEQVVAQLQLRSFSISRSAYSQIESGTYNIRISELIALAEIFQTDYNTIFSGLTYKKPWIDPLSFIFLHNLFHNSSKLLFLELYSPTPLCLKIQSIIAGEPAESVRPADPKEKNLELLNCL